MKVEGVGKRPNLFDDTCSPQMWDLVEAEVVVRSKRVFRNVFLTRNFWLCSSGSYFYWSTDGIAMTLFARAVAGVTVLESIKWNLCEI
jgi:hypothetical protein